MLVKVIFLSLIYVGVLSESILLSWIMLDLSTLVFIFLIFNLKLNYVNNLIHYYLIQVSASIGLFYSILFSLGGGLMFEWLFLLLKLGVFPFHVWYFMLLMKLDWESVFLLLSPTKLIGLMMMFNVMCDKLFSILLGSLFFVSYSALFEKNMKSLLGLSSIFNIVWVMSSFVLNYYWMLFFLGYSLNLFLIIWFMMRLDKEGLLESNYMSMWGSCLFLGLNVFILLGVPPFLSFYMKVFVLSELSRLGVYYMILVVCSIFFVYIYMMFFFYSLMSCLEGFGSLGEKDSSSYFSWVLLINIFFSLYFMYLYYLNNKS